MSDYSVLLVTPRWARNGGVGAHVIASATALARHGFRVGVLAAQLESRERVPGVELLQAPALFDRQAAPRVRAGTAVEFNADVIHLHQMDHPEMVDWLRGSAPVLVSAHGYTACASGLHYFRPGHECARGHGLGCVPQLLLRNCAHTRRPDRLPAAYERATRGLEAMRRADLAVSYSGAIDRHLAANALQRRALVPLFSTVTPRSGSGHRERRRVVFAGRVVSAKGVSVLVRAAHRLQGEIVVCGDGWQLESTRRLAQHLGVADRIDFKGWLPEDQIAEELAQASVVAVPSLWPEPFGLVGIEAMAAGRPVVASATGGTTDWLHDGVNGVLVHPGDARGLARALEELLDDPERQSTMGLAGQRLVADRFSPERHVAALERAYLRAGEHWRRARPASERVTATVGKPATGASG
ncbi:MAG TPA: glycosyltransferase family 4 protein [Solirubrobacteraceae bacterium]|jgi:glycosyltransferase involved in cell wall biosynthesis|nr:glycosyltransferase family 4 protein [Solirubrobacteraceae bacterium]